MLPTPPDPASQPPPGPEISSEWDEPQPPAPDLPAHAARWTWISGAVSVLGLALLALFLVSLARAPFAEVEKEFAAVLPPNAQTPQTTEALRTFHAHAGGIGRAFGLVAVGVAVLYALLGLGVRQGSRPATYAALILAIGQGLAVAWFLLNVVLMAAAMANPAAFLPALVFGAALAVAFQTIRLLWRARRLEG